jgi:hypothetical protein
MSLGAEGVATGAPVTTGAGALLLTGVATTALVSAFLARFLPPNIFDEHEENKQGIAMSSVQ